MDLKQSIVIVNEYTIKNGNKSGSRGGTPGDYVIRYMARDQAVEEVTPTRLYDIDEYIVRYMAREDAVDNTDSVSDLKLKMKRSQKYGGIAFGYGDASLSNEKLRSVSRDIQHQFDVGKTCMKTVISFDEDYLREHGILSEDFVFRKRGDYRGHIDQMKLRMAIMNGLSKMSKRYDDLQYVGVIQVDTKHVHCHLCMVDRGRGTLAHDGTQKGKLSSDAKKLLRRGIDTYLDRKQHVKMMSSSVMYSKRNAVCYIKKFTHKTMARHGLPQFLLACLPDNRNLWRASTNRKEMKKANNIVREYVLTLLEQPDSGYMESMQDILKYADYRTKHEGLSETEHNRLVRHGQSELINKCMDGVYGYLKQIPKSEMYVNTPMLDIMSLDYEDIAGQAVNDPMVEFGFKLRSYASRIKHHKKEYHRFKEEYKTYQKTENKSEDSKLLADFLQEEQEYNEMLMVKYQYFLSFLPAEEGIEDEFEALMDEKERLESLRKMIDDPSIKRMESNVAEEYGLRVYGQHGGHRVREQKEMLERRYDRFEQTVIDHEAAFREKLHDSGLDFDGVGITRKKMYDFEDVKALDLHHLGYDFPYDVQISKKNVDLFCEAANKRYRLFIDARDYLVASGQEAALSLLPEKDVIFMKQYADRLVGSDILLTSRPESGQFHRKKTVSLEKDYNTDIDMIIKTTIRSMQYDMVE